MARPPAARSSPGPGWILGFDVGGTKTTVLAGAADATVFDRREHASDARLGFDHMWTRMTAAADAVVGERGRPAAVGVSIGGPVDHRLGVVHAPPNLPGWGSVPLGARLAERYGAPVYVEHDAKAGLLAEWYFGAARGTSDAVFLTFGTGLGCGVLANGQLVRGVHERAGEVGHWRMASRGPRAYGKAGSWEAFASGAGISKLAGYLYPARWPESIGTPELVNLARSGDRAARQVIERSAAFLGRGVAQLVDLLDPEVVVLGSLASRAGDLFLPTVRRTVAAEALATEPACRIVPAELGERLGDVAALTAAIHHGGLGERGRPG